MALGLLGVRLFLAAVFVAALAGKLRDLAGFRQTLGGFGLPAPLIGTAALLIPASELAVAALLMPAAWAWWGAAAALAVLSAFTAAIALNLARGRRPDCRCFGSTAPSPIGLTTIARNGGLACCAALILVQGSGTPLASVVSAWRVASDDEHFLLTLVLALLVAIVAASRQVGELRRESARLTARVERLQEEVRLAAVRSSAVSASAVGGLGLPLGAEAPSFELPRLEGDRASLASLREAGLPVLLIFSSAHCPACAHLWPDIARWQKAHAGLLTIAAICGGPSQVIEMKLIGLEVQNVLLQADTAVSDAYNLSLTPSAVVVGADGRIESPVAEGVPAIRALVETRTAR
jgi:hypothetical protein